MPHAYPQDGRLIGSSAQLCVASQGPRRACRTMIPSTSDSIAALIWATLYVLVVAAEMRRRIHAGNSTEGIIRHGFREVPALQWLLQSACAIAVFSILTDCASALALGSLHGRVLLDSTIPAWVGCVALILAATAAAIALFGWAEHCKMRDAMIDLSKLEVGRRIGPDESVNGTSSSKVNEAPGSRPESDEWRALEFAGIGLLALGAVLQFSNASSASAVLAIDEVARFVASEVPAAVLRAALFPATVCLGVLTFDSAIPLTLSRFRRRLLRFGLLIFVALSAAALVVDGPARALSPCATGLAMMGVGLIGISIREAIDARRVRARHEVSRLRESIATGFSDCTRELESVAESGSIRPLDVDDVRSRIEKGLAGVEATSRLIPRFLGRLMKVTEVAATPVAAIGFRFLVVRRRIALEAPKHTKEKRRHPSVDLWDEGEYPIVPPNGYRAADDQRIVLPADYDVIKACKHCSGSGCVWEDESYSDTEWYTDSDGNTQWQTVWRTRSVTETCSDCSGSGSLHYRQVIVTSWTLWQPTLQSSTDGPTEDMFDETSELDVQRCPLVEDFRLTTEPKTGLASSGSWDSWIRGAADRARQLSARNAGLVADYFGGRVYRSELVLALTQAIRIKFTGLPGGIAWFAGASPKSHFRRLPLSWSTLFASALLPPLAAYGLIEGFALAHVLLGLLMPR